VSGQWDWVLSVRPRSVALRLGLVVVVLVGISVALNIGKVAGLGIPTWLVDLFRLNQEENAPSFFSGLLLAWSSTLSYVTFKKENAARRPRSHVWLFLSPLLLFLSFDELFGVHELLIDVVAGSFELPRFLQFAWEPVYAILVLVVGALFWPLWRSQTNRLRLILAISAVCFVGGALGFETLGGIAYEGTEGDIVYGLLYTVEESLEMIGVVVFIYGLLLIMSGSALTIDEDADGDAQSDVSHL
jgi:hypothetical protein